MITIHIIYVTSEYTFHKATQTTALRKQGMIVAETMFPRLRSQATFFFSETFLFLRNAQTAKH